MTPQKRGVPSGGTRSSPGEARSPPAAPHFGGEKPTHLVEDLLQVGGAHAVGHVPVGGVGQEEFALGRQRRPDVLLAIDVLLAPVDHPDVAWGGPTAPFLFPERLQGPPLPALFGLVGKWGVRCRGFFFWGGVRVPLRRGSSLFSSTSRASVPSSIRSSLVITPIVRKPGAAKKN